MSTRDEKNDLALMAGAMLGGVLATSSAPMTFGAARRWREAALKHHYHKLGPRSYRCYMQRYGDRSTGKGTTPKAAFVAAFRNLKERQP